MYAITDVYTMFTCVYMHICTYIHVYICTYEHDQQSLSDTQGRYPIRLPPHLMTSQNAAVDQKKQQSQHICQIWKNLVSNAHQICRQRLHHCKRWQNMLLLLIHRSVIGAALMHMMIISWIDVKTGMAISYQTALVIQSPKEWQQKNGSQFYINLRRAKIECPTAAHYLDWINHFKTDAFYRNGFCLNVCMKSSRTDGITQST